MKVFLITCGSLFALVVVLHLTRMGVEPRMVRDPWFWLITIVAGALSLWAWRLVWLSRKS